ncbi:MAG: hypothetical protein WCA49_00895 [Candidatus Sulfotelmatobacter sp.]
MLSHKLNHSVILLGALLLAAPAASNAQYAINLFAGGGPNGLSAITSSIGYPGGVAQDASGNTYIADSYSNRVFKVDASGTLTVFAGNGLGIGGEDGYSGDGGPATSAELSRPEGVAVDAAGDVFIADTDNSVIRCVVGSLKGCFGSALAAGDITTVAGIYYPTTDTCNYSGDGSLATSAYLCQPGGVFVDGSGNIFIADTENSVVREVLAANNNIQTVAGSGLPCGAVSPCGDGAAATSAELDLPGGVFVDGAGDIFIADTYDSVIREVAAATGNIQTVAGTYYTYIQNGDVCEYTGDGALATLAGICQPSGVSVDSAGDIFIADSLNSAIRCVVGSAGGCFGSAYAVGDITTVAGNYAMGAGYSGDGGPATSAQLNDPNGLLLDGSGDILIADTENSLIRCVVGSSGGCSGSTLAVGDITSLTGNHTVAYSGDGNLATVAELYADGGVFADGSGNVFIADSYNCVIREVLAATGYIQTVAGNGTCGYAGDGAAATSAELNYPGGVFVDSLGDIFIADTLNSLVREVVAATGYIQTVAGDPALVAGYSGDNGPATSAQLYEPYGVFVDSSGDIFIADTTNSAIRCVVGTALGCFGSTLAVGDITTVAGTPTTPCSANNTFPICGDGGLATSAYLSSPAGVFGDALGDILIADTFDSKIRCVVGSAGGCFGSTLAVGSITTVAGTGSGGYSGDGGLATSGLLDDPYGVFVDSFGNIFIADTDNSVVREVVAVTGNIQTIAGNGTEGYAGDGGTATSAELDHPLGIAGGLSGSLFIADTENSRVRELSSTVNEASVPSSATVPAGASQQFATTVTGASDTSVTWQVNGVTGGNAATVGAISPLGSYQAPAAVPSPATVTVTAVANANGVNRASATVNIISGSGTAVTVSTSPTVTEVYTGTTQTFAANVTGITNTAVNWQVDGVTSGNSTVGTISATGTYSAPTAVPTPATVMIGAVSQAMSNVSAVYPIVLANAPTASQPASQTINAGGTATYDISLNPNTGDPEHPITLACLNSSLPLNATCTFSPSTITPALSPVPFTLTVNVPTGSASLEKPNRMWLAPQLFAAFLPIGALLFIGLGKRGSEKRRKRRQWLPFLFLLCVSLGWLIGCGGSSTSPSNPSNPEAGSYSVQVQGTTAAQPNPITITTASLTVQ